MQVKASNRRVAGLGLSLALFFALCAEPMELRAQGKSGIEPPAVDPYTRGDPASMSALGLRSFGPFPFGDGRSTDEITRAADGAPFLWVETAHFQIGLSIKSMPMPRGSRGKQALRADLGQLNQRLPDLPRRPKKIDPWLALHLTAGRLEALFSTFVARLGLEKLAEQEPYLGSGGPICILLTQSESTLSRFTDAAFGIPCNGSWHGYFHAPRRQLFFGLAIDSLEASGANGDDLHFALVHNVTRVLANSVRGYYQSIPDWFSLGLAHCFARDLVSDEILFYATPVGTALRTKVDANFAVKVRRRVANDFYPSFEEMEAWTDTANLSFPDHMMAWSKVDFLLRSDGGARAHAFLMAASEPVGWGVAERGQLLAKHRHEALANLGGGDIAQLDKLWAQWVLKEYSKR